jgi:transcriptional regulator with XRE-family HTH domain
MSEKSIFATNMKKARKLKGWSQEGAAQAIREAGIYDFKRSTLGAYEEGRVLKIKYEIQKAIQSVYGIEDFERFINDSDYFKETVSAYVLQRKYRELSGNSKKVVDMLLGLVRY